MLRRLALKLEILYKLDRFQATNAGGNKYGKAVKIPLSCHRKGMYSQLINCTEEYSLQPVTTQSKQFLDTQYKILEKYSPAVFTKLQQKRSLDLQQAKADTIFRNTYYVNSLIQFDKQGFCNIAFEGLTNRSGYPIIWVYTRKMNY